jgi:hypothetical protein
MATTNAPGSSARASPPDAPPDYLMVPTFGYPVMPQWGTSFWMEPA